MTRATANTRTTPAAISMVRAAVRTEALAAADLNRNCADSPSTPHSAVAHEQCWMPRYTVDVSKERLASAGQRRLRTPAVFGNVIASRSYIWIPPVGRPRPVAFEIGPPARISEAEWVCAFRISGLPKAIEAAAHGSDAVQALELALVGAGAYLSRSPQFRAGQIEMHGHIVKNAAELFLPLPMNSIQGALENLRGYLERQEEKERRSKRDWFDPEWRRALLSMMREISGDLATLAAHLPIRPRTAHATTTSAAGKRRRSGPARG